MAGETRSTHGRRASLRFRLLAGTLGWIAATLLLGAWGLASLFGDHVARQLDAELATHLDQLIANLQVGEADAMGLRLPLSDPRLSRPFSGLYWQVDRLADDRSPGSRGVLRSRSMWDSVLVAPADALADGEIHTHRLEGPDGNPVRMMERVIAPAEFPESSLRVMVAVDERALRDPVSRFSGMLALSLGTLGAGLVVAVLLQVVVGLRPLRDLRRTLAAVREGRASAAEGAFPSEIQPLVDDFNGVLARNAEIVARARTQAGNLAHAVKTPLAVLSNAAADEDSPLSHLVREQVATALRQVDHHLARSRAAAAVGVPGLRTPVRPVVDALVRTMERVHSGRALAFDVGPMAGDPVFGGEEQDLQEMLGNLLDNACKWASSRVAIEAGRNDGGILVTVDDDGAGLPLYARDRVFERGVRADEELPGSGLGLAIVRDLVQLYGGTVRMEASPLGGSRVELTLPGA